MDNNKIHYSRGENKFDNQPKQLEVENFTAFAKAILSDVGKAKGEQFICAPFSRGLHDNPKKYPGEEHWRLKKLAMPRRWLPVDYDGFKDAAACSKWRKWLSDQDLSIVIYTTASHTAERPRARAIIELSRPVTRDESILLGPIFEKIQQDALGSDFFKFDKSVYQSEQPCYLPVRTSKGTIFEGKPLDVDSLLATSSVFIGGIDFTDVATGTGALTTALAGNGWTGWPEYKLRDGEGRRKKMLSYAGHLRSLGHPQETINQLCREANAMHLADLLDDDVVIDLAERYQHQGCTAKPDSNPALQIGPQNSLRVALDPIVELNELFAWDMSEMNLYQIAAGRYVQKDRFITQYANRYTLEGSGEKAKPVPLGSAWFKSPIRRNTPGVVLAPGQPATLSDGRINSWQGFSCSPVAGDVTPFLALLKRLIPARSEHEFVLNWIARLIQTPAAKFNVSLVISSPTQGTGKNLIFEAVGSLFHERHFIVVGQSVFEDGFNEWQSDKIMVVADEISSTDKRAVSDRIKGWITATKNHINVKNAPKTSQPNLIKYVFLSNHPDAVHVTNTDRRFFVVEATSNQLSEQDIARYVNWRDSGGRPALLHYLLAHDTRSFNPMAPAPLSQAKLDMVESNKSDLERWLERRIAIAQHEGKPLLTSESLSQEYKGDTGHASSSKTMAHALVQLGARKIKKLARFPNGSRTQLFTIADPEAYKDMTDTELGDAFQAQLIKD
jgi:hypothetical protein